MFAILINDDTLETARTITAIVGLQPNHNPQGVTVQVLGSDLYANVNDKDGHFTFDKLARGTYRLKLETTYEGYTTTYKTITISETTPDTLPDTLWMIYTGIPVVTGLNVSYDTLAGTVLLTWHQPVYSALQDYVIFKDEFTSTSRTKIPVAITDTFFVDTIFRNKNSTPAFSFSDTNDYHYKYRVAVRNNSDIEGQTYKFVDIVAASPTKVTTTFSFTKYHVGKNTFSDSCSINDTIIYCVTVSNPTREIKNISWTNFYASRVLRSSSLDSAQKFVKDTLKYLWGTVGNKNLECCVIDNAGTIWKDTVSISVVQDNPVAALSYMPLNDVLHLNRISINDSAKLSLKIFDTYGTIEKTEWDFGNTGKYYTDSIINPYIEPVPKTNIFKNEPTKD